MVENRSQNCASNEVSISKGMLNFKIKYKKILKLRDTTELYEQLFATTVGPNQSETPIHSPRHLVGSSQWMMQTDARKFA